MENILIACVLVLIFISVFLAVKLFQLHQSQSDPTSNSEPRWVEEGKTLVVDSEQLYARIEQAVSLELAKLVGSSHAIATETPPDASPEPVAPAPTELEKASARSKTP